jgi:methyltransferase family protein
VGARTFIKDRIARVTANLMHPRILGDPRYFDLWQARGFHVTPVHFYQPVPDTRTLRDSLWTERGETPGVDFREADQVDLLRSLAADYRSEYERLPREPEGAPYDFYLNNGGFRSVDAEILYCMIRRFKRRRMIEIGSGLSTCLAAGAILKNSDEASSTPCRFTAVDPYPAAIVRDGIPGLSELLATEVQDVPICSFLELEQDDILFIDSSHVLRIGSDVQYECLEILPRLRPGVLVHVHDIFLPAEYPRGWVLGQKRFWTEQYLLQAFLAFNEVFRVLLAASYLHLRRPDVLESAFPSYDRSVEWPGSFWMRRVR